MSNLSYAPVSDQPPTKLPTLQEVAAFLHLWRDTVLAIPGMASTTLTCHPTKTGLEFRALVWDGTSPESVIANTPDALTAMLIEHHAPAVKACALRAKATELLQQAEELERGPA